MSGSETVEAAEVRDRRAGCVPLTVVAAKKPGAWIVRAMSPFAGVSTLRLCVERVVGVLDPDIEWSQHEYEGWPGYVVYGEQDLPHVGWPTGVFKFDHKGGDCYGPAQRVGDVR